MKFDFAVGYAFSENLRDVVLICKEHPVRMAGKINGPGGGFDAEKGDKDILDTMIRKFEKQSGVKTGRRNWIPVTSFRNPNGKLIQVFCAKGDDFLKAETVPSIDKEKKTEEILIFKAEAVSCHAHVMPEVPEQIKLSLKILNFAIPKPVAA